jgi:hypothetical protein
MKWTWGEGTGIRKGETDKEGAEAQWLQRDGSTANGPVPDNGHATKQFNAVNSWEKVIITF